MAAAVVVRGSAEMTDRMVDWVVVKDMLKIHLERLEELTPAAAAVVVGVAVATTAAPVS
jgi:hypothetical protein